MSGIWDQRPESRRVAGAGRRALPRSVHSRPENETVQPARVRRQTNTAQGVRSHPGRRADTTSEPRLCLSHSIDLSRLEPLSLARCPAYFFLSFLGSGFNLNRRVHSFQPDFPPIHELAPRTITHFSVAETLAAQ